MAIGALKYRHVILILQGRMCALRGSACGRRTRPALGTIVQLVGTTPLARAGIVGCVPNLSEGRDIGWDPAKTPDLGPHRIHPSAGCTPIGARPFLVAYNIKAQVSMNLLDIDVTSPAKVFAKVSERAAAQGVGIHRSEIVGLLPERAVFDAAAQFLKLRGEEVASHLVEAKVRAAQGPTLDGWIDELASVAPAPGGGSAAALAGALAAALVAMVGRLTSSRKAYAAVAEEFKGITEEAERLRLELRRLVDEDAESYRGVMAAYKLPKGTDGEVKARQEAIDKALLGAAEVPLRTARAAARVVELARRAAEAGNKNAVCDAGVGALLGMSAVKGAVYNVAINVKGLAKQEVGKPVLEEAGGVAQQAGKEAAAAERTVTAALVQT